MVEVLVKDKNVLLFSAQRSGTTAFIQHTIKHNQLNNQELIDFSYGLQYRYGRKVLLDESGTPFPIQDDNETRFFPSDDEYKNIFYKIEKFNNNNKFYIAKVLLNHNVVYSVLQDSSIYNNTKKVILWRHPFDIILSTLAVKSPVGAWYGPEYDNYHDLSIDVEEHEDKFKYFIQLTNNLITLYQENQNEFEFYNYNSIDFKYAYSEKQRTEKFNNSVFKNINVLEKYRNDVKLPF